MNAVSSPAAATVFAPPPLRWWFLPASVETVAAVWSDERDAGCAGMFHVVEGRWCREVFQVAGDEMDAMTLRELAEDVERWHDERASIVTRYYHASEGALAC